MIAGRVRKAGRRESLCDGPPVCWAGQYGRGALTYGGISQYNTQEWITGGLLRHRSRLETTYWDTLHNSILPLSLAFAILSDEPTRN